MRKSIIVKVTAFMLCTLMLISTALSVFGVIGLLAGQFYTKPLDEIRKDTLRSTMSRYATDAAYNYHYSYENMEDFTANRNLYFEIRDAMGSIVYSNYEGQNVIFTEHFGAWIEEWEYIGDPAVPDTDPVDTGAFEDTDTANVTEAVPETDIPEDETEVTANPHESALVDTGAESLYDEYYVIGHEKLVVYEYDVTVHLPNEFFTTDIISFIDHWINALYEMRNGIYIVGGVSALLFVIFMVMLCCVSGWKKGEDKPRTCLFDKIPFDIFTAVYVFIFTIAIAFFSDFYFEDFEFVMFIIAAIVIGSVLLISYIYSFAARAKTGELFRNTVIWWILKNILKFLRFICRGIGKVLANLPLYGKTILILITLGLWTLFLMLLNPYYVPFVVFLWIWGGTIIALLALYITYGLNKLKKGGERIAKGDYTHRIDKKHMLPSLRSHADSLNNISGGMSNALEERLKSERFKTELITNVSHDLKTPLTSIVNYIDLLKNERTQNEPDEEKIEEYIEVLDRQSARLRKLTEDLVEASKASTGNLEVSPAPIELGEMISQTQGEYAEKLSSLGLDLIVRLPSEPLTIMADGKHLWRIFDNLMNNIGKYALGGTRVYIDVFEKVGKAYIIFRNTSRYELNVSAEELTERFVRGDSSRHTEGSGLGLSIARSLAELNGGKLDIYIDGDLFKVVIGFDTMKKPPKGIDGEKNDFV